MFKDKKIIITNIYGEEIKKGLGAYVKDFGFAYLYELSHRDNLAYFRWENEEKGIFTIKICQLKKLIDSTKSFF